MPAFVDDKIGCIDEEKGTVPGESVKQKSCIEAQPSRDRVARCGPPILFKYFPQVAAHSVDCSLAVIGQTVTAVLLRQSATMHYRVRHEIVRPYNVAS